jgi:hypothetical protein
LLLALLAAGSLSVARAEPRTVCTITVNSSDEKEAFQKRLPRARYRFVELLEKGRDDWMKSSCEMAIPCDVLVISGHFNAGDSFYSDKVEAKEQLNVDELERASCSNSCPALFSRLKEVYLFGCESLNPDASKYSSSHSESGLERMRRIFANVPVIYGFPSSAPLGPTAAALLDRNFDGAALSVGSGHASSRLLRSFSANHMTAVAGVGQSGDGAARRGQICQFFDARLTPAGKLAWVHAMMQRDMGQASAFFERIEHLLASLTDAERLTPAFLNALAEISVDDATRERYLAVERATRSAPLRSRMIALADNLGWLSPEERTTELAGLIGDVLASPSIGFADVDLVCSMGEVPDLNREALRARVVPSRSRNAAPDACSRLPGRPPGAGADSRRAHERRRSRCPGSPGLPAPSPGLGCERAARDGEEDRAHARNGRTSPRARHPRSPSRHRSRGRGGAHAIVRRGDIRGRTEGHRRNLPALGPQGDCAAGSRERPARAPPRVAQR